MIRIFIGYDPRESCAYHVCANSIIRNSSVPVSITPLALGNLAKVYEENHTDGSNQFIYTRFLVPFLCHFMGRAVYLDGDMIVRGDIAELLESTGCMSAVNVVKHDYKTKASHKYLGAKNEDYPRKNWSSVIVWDCAHFQNRCLTPGFVMSKDGAFLHRFSWLDDRWVGDLPATWNWLETEYEANDDAQLIHYTLGAPCFLEYSDTPMAHFWHEEARRTMNAIGEIPENIMSRAAKNSEVKTRVSER